MNDQATATPFGAGGRAMKIYGDSGVPMRDNLRWVITDPAEAVIVHEALLSYRNREPSLPTDWLRRDATDRLLARFDWAINEMADLLRRESEVPR